MSKNDNALRALVNRREFWKEHPEVFAAEVLGVTLTPEQRMICRELIKHNQLAIKSANSVGKSFLFAIIIIWFFFCHISKDNKVICLFTAPVFGQLKTGLQADILNFIGIANDNLAKYGVKLFDRVPSEDRNKAEFWQGRNYILGVTTDTANALSGRHGDYVLVIFDEAQGIKEDVYSGFGGIMQSGIVKEVLLGNTTLPNGCSGRFYEAFGEHSPYKQISITSFDTPNFVLTDIKLEDYFLPETDYNYWRKKLDRYCGTDYRKAKRDDAVGKWENDVKEKLPFQPLTNPIAVYKELVKAGFNTEDYEIKTRILAEFPDGAGSSTYPLSWIHKAKEDYNDCSKFVPGLRSLGIDFGRGVGKDKSSFCIVDGNKPVFLEEFNLDTRGILDKVDELHLSQGFDCIKLENNGEGIVFERLLREKKYKVYSVDVGSVPGFGKTANHELNQKTERYKKNYVLKRDELWWYLRLRIDPLASENDEPRLLLPPILELEREMRASTYRKNHKQQIMVSTKDELRLRLKRSTDMLDSLLIAIAEIKESNYIDVDASNLYTFNLKAS